MACWKWTVGVLMGVVLLVMVGIIVWKANPTKQEMAQFQEDLMRTIWGGPELRVAQEQIEDNNRKKGTTTRPTLWFGDLRRVPYYQMCLQKGCSVLVPDRDAFGRPRTQPFGDLGWEAYYRMCQQKGCSVLHGTLARTKKPSGFSLSKDLRKGQKSP